MPKKSFTQMNTKVALLIVLLCAGVFVQNAYASFRIKNTAKLPFGHKQFLPDGVNDSTIRQLYAEQSFKKPNERHYRYFRRAIVHQMRYQKSWREGLSISLPLMRPLANDTTIRKLYDDLHIRKPSERGYRRFQRGMERQLIYMKSRFALLSIIFSMYSVLFAGLVLLDTFAFFLFPFYYFYGIVGIGSGITSLISKNESKKGWAIAGIILSVFSLLLLAIL